MRDEVSWGVTRPMRSPLLTASVYAMPDLDTLDRVLTGKETGYIYARDAHPNSTSLAAQLNRWHGATWGLITGTGMSALSLAFLGLVQPGDRIVSSRSIYGRTRQLLDQELARFGVRTDGVDTNDLDAVRRCLQQPTRVLFVETISNPLLRIADISALAELAHAAQACLFIDNTFASPLLCRPLELGADLVMESLTKMISGHSDVTLGYLGGREATLAARMQQIRSIWGFSGNPFDCWLTERGMETLHLRMQAACANAARLAQWLTTQPRVRRVIYPDLPEHPDHALAQRLLPAGRGNMLGLELEGGRDEVNQWLRRVPGIPFCPSLGDTQTTCSHPDTTSHRYDSAAEKAAQGITPGLIRLSVGCEPFEQLQAELARGFGNR